jgi:hypothetical protein
LCSSVHRWPECVSARKARHALIMSLGLLMLSLPAFSQLNSGSIAGGITDQTGAVIVGATVTVIDVERGVSRPLITDSAGQYTAPSLTPGEYTIRADAPGFQTVQRAKVIVGVGQAVRVDIQLQPGAQAETVTVTEAVPLVDTSNEVISNTVETATLNELPINGRLYTKVLDFQPGIIGRPGGQSPNYSANGAGGQSNYWMLDGVENVNIFINGGPLIGSGTSNDELTILPADAIQEVNVMANPPAEFGWFQGAVVNVGLKSGTNTIHGSAYGFGRNNSLEAYNPFLNGISPKLPKADDNFQQYGASLSGRIKKDKLFYFGNFEGMRYTVGAPSLINTPTASRNAQTPADSLPLAVEDLIARGVTPSPLSLNLAGCTVAGGVASCDPTKGIFPNSSTVSENIPVALDNIGSSNNVIGKIDYHLNDRNAINGEYFFGNANTDTPTTGAAPWWINGNLSRTQMNRGVWIYTPNSSWVNEVRFGWNWYHLADSNAECTRQVGQPNYQQLGFVSGANPPSPMCGFPVVNIAGGAQSFAGLGSATAINDQLVNQQTETVYDNASYIRGNHQFKFGIEFHHSGYNGLGAPGNFAGTLNFTGGLAFAGNGSSTALQDFLAGKPASGSILVNPQSNSVGFNRHAGYFSDDFRLTRKLTVNLGLRYELEPAILVDGNNAANFDPTSPTGMVQQSGKPLYHTDHHDFAPRAGFAWDLTGKGTTVFRAGMGVSYDTPQVDDLIAQGFGAGLNNIPTGFTLYNPAGNIAFAPSTAPGAVTSGTVTVPSSGLNWVCNNTSPNCPGAPATVIPVFTVGTSALECGNGLVRAANGTTPSPCNLHAKSVNSPRSPMFTWTVGIQRAFTSSTSLTVNYVGTHAYNIATMVNINEPTPGASTALPGSTPGSATGSYQFREPYYSRFPWFSGIFLYEPAGFSNYNALQVSLTQRAFHGLTMRTNYSFAKDLATTKGGNNPFVQDGRNVAGYYGRFTPAHHLGITLTYAIPGIKSPAQLLRGWEINSSINVQSGPPVNPVDATDDFAGIGGTRALLGGASEQWSLVGDPRNFHIGKTTPTPCYAFAGGRFASNPNCLPLTLSGDNGPGQACINAANQEAVNAQMNAEIPGSSSGLASLQRFGCYVSPNGKSVLLPPAQGTFGTMGRNALFGAAFGEWDFSVSKRWIFGERAALQFRAEFFNFLNNRAYSGGTTTITNPATFGLATSAPNSSNPINGTGGPREVQLGLKMTF